MSFGKNVSPQEGRGIRCEGFLPTNSTTLGKRAEKCWRPKKFIVVDWIKLRYIKICGLEDVRCRVVDPLSSLKPDDLCVNECLKYTKA